ncbi:MAG: Asp-tRNA(Asn)/Glu-tRNA(Gln) amidotransferase subunit GatC [Alphaproteobacteria bacterium]|nr:Asp-tRNA(Asn)/Glu-tRNA(Gln) amidotransferase subunit GatC [Alphaproteobacteria bacterium]
MSFNEQTIKTIANLARLKFPQEDEAKFAKDINGILDWVEQLKEVNVDGVEPLVSVSPRENAVRADVVTDGSLQTELMANAPESVQGFYEVPRMVE